MKVVFLDIDGVLNSNKEILQHGSLFILTPDVKNKLSAFGCLFISRLASKAVKIVLSSTWRLGSTREHWEEAFPFPIYDKTCSYPFPGSIRGDEIEFWLNDQLYVERYCIIDDDCDMLKSQSRYFVRTDFKEGLSFKDAENVCEILGMSIYDLIDR